MRIVGKVHKPIFGPRRPTESEIQASIENARLSPLLVPKGVYKYQNHAEADADMDRWIAEGMARRSAELDRSSKFDDEPPTPKP